jgi:tRNA dimethylallyltransferase
MQAYRGMDIGTAKPGSDLLSRLPHRLIDIRDISEQYTAGDFVRLADEACAEIAQRGKLPVVSGGTGFYARNFICGMPAAPAADRQMRSSVAADLAAKGAAALRAELAAVDPDSASRIHENDFYRLTRAIEITRSTGRPMADFAPLATPRAGYRFAVFCLELPREELYARIGARVDAMMAAGLPEEAAALRRAGHSAQEPGMQAIGYREFFDIGLRGPAEIAEAIKRDTRRYAKRQMTFFRGLPGVRIIGPDPGTFASLLRDAIASSGAPPLRSIVQSSPSAV